jgi:PHD/YefM family antitoxin component YafN of YafNO toxin-antitoxin module
MPKTYLKPDVAVKKLLTDVIKKIHPELENLRIGLVMVEPNRDAEGNRTGHAITRMGTPVVAKISKVSIEKRVHTPFEAIVLIDAERWESMRDDQQKALLDHELTHLELVRDEAGKVVQDDDLRPKIRLRPDDWVLTGFLDVVKRHGDAAVEYQAIRDLVLGDDGQLVFDFVKAPRAARKAS